LHWWLKTQNLLMSEFWKCAPKWLNVNTGKWDFEQWDELHDQNPRVLTPASPDRGSAVPMSVNPFDHTTLWAGTQLPATKSQKENPVTEVPCPYRLSYSWLPTLSAGYSHSVTVVYTNMSLSEKSDDDDFSSSSSCSSPSVSSSTPVSVWTTRTVADTDDDVLRLLRSGVLVALIVSRWRMYRPIQGPSRATDSEHPKTDGDTVVEHFFVKATPVDRRLSRTRPNAL